MNAIRFDSKESFIAALEGRRRFWRDVDKGNEVAHKAKEREWLSASRDRMRVALKLDYEALKELVDWNGRLPLGDNVEECPRLWEPRLDDVLAALALTSGKTFTVDSNGGWSEAHTLLTHDPNTRRTVC